MSANFCVLLWCLSTSKWCAKMYGLVLTLMKPSSIKVSLWSTYIWWLFHTCCVCVCVCVFFGGEILPLFDKEIEKIFKIFVSLVEIQIVFFCFFLKIKKFSKISTSKKGKKTKETNTTHVRRTHWWIQSKSQSSWIILIERNQKLLQSWS